MLVVGSDVVWAAVTTGTVIVLGVVGAFSTSFVDTADTAAVVATAAAAVSAGSTTGSWFLVALINIIISTRRCHIILIIIIINFIIINFIITTAVRLRIAVTVASTVTHGKNGFKYHYSTTRERERERERETRERNQWME